MNQTTSEANKQNTIIQQLVNSQYSQSLQIPSYLEETYWWAYVHPKALAVFERQWLVNLILWGNFVRLRDAALNLLGSKIQGRTLQVACVYGNFSEKLVQRMDEHGQLDIIDILPIQIDNIRRKLHSQSHVHVMQRDSSKLNLPDESYDQIVIFFLLHEQPATVRTETLSEVLRVLKPGGKLVIVDYHQPSVLHPLRYIFKPILNRLEPFALDLWRYGIEKWLPTKFKPSEFMKKNLFGGLYQIVLIRK